MTTDARPLNVRRMTEADIDSVASTLGWPRAGIENRYREQAEGKREIFVAEVGGTPAGSMSMNDQPDVPGLLHLFALDMTPPYQRQGCGTALIATVEREALQRGLDGVWLDVAVDNADARRLYERLGYRREGATVVNRWSYTDESGARQNNAETCYRMIKRFAGLDFA